MLLMHILVENGFGRKALFKRVSFISVVVQSWRATRLLAMLQNIKLPWNHAGFINTSLDAHTYTHAPTHTCNKPKAISVTWAAHTDTHRDTHPSGELFIFPEHLKAPYSCVFLNHQYYRVWFKENPRFIEAPPPPTDTQIFDRLHSHPRHICSDSAAVLRHTDPAAPLTSGTSALFILPQSTPLYAQTLFCSPESLWRTYILPPHTHTFLFVSFLRL